MDEQQAEDARPPRPLVVACAVLGLQVLALVAAIVLAGAAALVLCIRGLLRLRPAARPPAVVIEALALPVSYSLAFQAGRVGYGAPIMLSALAVIYLMFTPPVRAVLDRPIDD